MTCAVIIQPRAVRDVDRHADFIGERDVSAGRRFVAAFQKALETLRSFPDIAYPYEFANLELQDLRFWPIKGFENYLIFYRPAKDAIVVSSGPSWRMRH